MILAIIYLALIIILTVISNMAFPVVVSIDLIFNIGIGPIICLISSILIILLSRRESASYSENGGYDNADVSFAPYVVGYEAEKR